MGTNAHGDDGDGHDGGGHVQDAEGEGDAVVQSERKGAAPSAAVAKKRLLPMELRRRRRAAKLLVSPLGKTSGAPSAQDDPVPTEQQQEASGDQKRIPALKRSADELEDSAEVHAPGASPGEDKGDVHITAAASLSRSVSTSSSVLPTPGSAASRLSSFYNWSAVDKKRQRLQTRMLTDVPSKFHFYYQKEIHGVLRGGDFKAWHATPLPASITLNRMAVATKSDPKAGGKSELLRGEVEFYAARLRQWQDAFRDVYFGFRGLRAGGRQSFYVRANDCTVCFYQETSSSATAAAATTPGSNDLEGNLPLLEICRKLREQSQPLSSQSEEPASGGGERKRKKRGTTRLFAVMSQSTARVRKALHRLHVEYSTPYSSSSSTQRDIGQFHLLEEELVAMERTAAASSRVQPLQQNVHGADSLLYFAGHQAVHGLYEFLINRKPLTKEDVPEIYALHPFANAAIKSLDVKYMGHVAAGLTLNEESTGTMFRTEVSGFCFPSALRSVLEILKDEYLRDHSHRHEPTPRSRIHYQQHQQEDDAASASAKGAPGIAIRAYMEQIPLTERFNSLHLSQGAIRKKAVSGTTLEEREKWKQELELSKRRIESVILRDSSSDMQDESALFEVETTARTS